MTIAGELLRYEKIALYKRMIKNQSNNSMRKHPAQLEYENKQALKKYLKSLSLIKTE